MTWKETVGCDIAEMGTDWDGVKAMANDRGLWRGRVARVGES